MDQIDAAISLIMMFSLWIYKEIRRKRGRSATSPTRRFHILEKGSANENHLTVRSL